MQVYKSIKKLISNAIASAKQNLQSVLEEGFYAQSLTNDSFVTINPLNVNDPLFDVQLQRVSQNQLHYFYLSQQIFNSFIEDANGLVDFKQQPFEDTYLINRNKYLTVRENKLTLKVPQISYGSEFILKENDDATTNKVYIMPLSVQGNTPNPLTCDVKIWRNAVPASPTATGKAGEIAYDSGNLYICINTDTWRSVALGLFGG